MSEQPRVSDRKPQKGDRVRITYEAEYRNGWEAVGKDGTVTYPADATVELLEPTDDPSKDPVGALRREDVTGEPHFNIWQRVANPMRWLCTHSTATGMVGEVLQSDQVTGFEVIGSVPGTPAAEANPVPPQVLVRVKEMLTNGQKSRAVKALREACFGLGLKEARAYAESLPEWAVGDRALGDQIRDGLELSPHGWEPKVWHSTGEEPPRDGRCLEYIDISDNVLHYLKNFGDMWLWVETPDAPDPRPEIGQWPPNHPGRYREVQP